MALSVGKGRSLWRRCIKGNIWHLVALLLSSIVLGVSVVSVSFLRKQFIDIATGESVYSLGQVLCFAAAVLFLLGAAQIAVSRLQGELFCRIELGLRQDIMASLSRANGEAFDANPLSLYMTRLTKDVEGVASFIAKTLISSIFFEIFTFLISFTAMIFLEWRLAVVMIVLVPLLILLMVFLSPKLAEYSNKILSSEENNRQEIQDFLDNYLVVKSYGLAGWMKKRMEKSYSDKRGYTRSQCLLEGILGFLNNFLGVGLFVVALSIGAFLVMQGLTTVGTLIAVVNLVSFFYGPFLHVSGWISEINAAKSSAQRIQEVLSIPKELRWNHSEEREQITVRPLAEKAELQVFQLAFGYNEEKTLFSDLSLQIHTGEILAIDGKNGSGKSTLAKLLAGLYEPEQGSIVLRFQDDKISGKHLQQYITYDPGTPSLFQGTIQENICLDSPVDTDCFHEAVKLAGLEEVIAEKGPLFPIESGGKNLSSGQKRKICLARFFYHRKKVLLLDEPTSNLDAKSVEDFWKSLAQCVPGRICIVISHEKDTIDHCDRVINLGKCQAIQGEEK